jgi:hypothetical protein
LTGLPYTKFSGLVAGGKYNVRSDAGSESRCCFEAWVEVMEHQGAST